MATSIPWESGIQELNALRHKVIESYREDLPRIRPPTTDDELAAAERQLGMPINSQYREFLKCANGWEGICGDLLFGTDEFLRKNDFLRIVSECFDAYVEFKDEWAEPTPLDNVTAEDLLAIGLESWAGALTLIGREGRPCAGQVFFIYNTAINVYEDFSHFFFTRYLDHQRSASEIYEPKDDTSDHA
jgi:hypothetical protein